MVITYYVKVIGNNWHFVNPRLKRRDTVSDTLNLKTVTGVSLTVDLEQQD